MASMLRSNAVLATGAEHSIVWVVAGKVNSKQTWYKVMPQKVTISYHKAAGGKIAVWPWKLRKKS